jgi:hypothetical protein
VPLAAFLVGSRTPTTFELWDATTLRPVGAPTDLPDRTAWTPNPNADGAQLASGSIDGSGDAVVWDLQPQHWEALACQIAGRNLTAAEWKQYLPGRAYDLTCPR